MLYKTIRYAHLNSYNSTQDQNSWAESVFTSWQTEPLSVVFEYIENADFRSLYPRFSAEDVRYYMKELLKALEFSHSKGVMHRDIRPHNIMIDHSQRKVGISLWPPVAFPSLLDYRLMTYMVLAASIQLGLCRHLRSEL